MVLWTVQNPSFAKLLTIEKGMNDFKPFAEYIVGENTHEEHVDTSLRARRSQTSRSNFLQLLNTILQFLNVLGTIWWFLFISAANLWHKDPKIILS